VCADFVGDIKGVLCSCFIYRGLIMREKKGKGKRGPTPLF